MQGLYVSSRFSFKDDKKKDLIATKARQTRAEHRRKVIEVGESEKERHASAVEGLLLIQDSQFAIDAGTQTEIVGSSFSWVWEHVEMTSTVDCTPIPLILNSAAARMSPITTPSASTIAPCICLWV